jgi:hypothetical protein
MKDIHALNKDDAAATKDKLPTAVQNQLQAQEIPGRYAMEFQSFLAQGMDPSSAQARAYLQNAYGKPPYKSRVKHRHLGFSSRCPRFASPDP